jgi:ATP-grasp ribosomal peptide maturase
MSTVVVITYWFDPTADFVVEELNKRSVTVFRFDVSDFPKRLDLVASLQAEGWNSRLCLGSREVALEEVTGIYFRRPTTFDFGAIPEATAQWARAEARSGLGGLLMASDKWLNHPHRSGYAEFKPLQLSQAQRVGLKVPKTLITNNPGKAEEFVKETESVIYKPLSSAVLPYGAAEGGTMLYASVVTPEALTDSAGVASTTHMFQERIEHKYAVRLTVVDGQMFAAAIHAQSEESLLDWRSDYSSLRYEVIDVPPDICHRVAEFMRFFRLRFGAFDFLVTPQGEWVFLEINPNGQWAWIETETGLPIASAIADALTKQVV